METRETSCTAKQQEVASSALSLHLYVHVHVTDEWTVGKDSSSFSPGMYDIHYSLPRSSLTYIYIYTCIDIYFSSMRKSAMQCQDHVMVIPER